MQSPIANLERPDLVHFPVAARYGRHGWWSGFDRILFVVLSLLGPMGPDPSLAQVQDTTPPQLLSFSFSPTTIDVTGGPQSVVVTYTATDDLSGVRDSGALNFVGPSGQTTPSSRGPAASSQHKQSRHITHLMLLATLDAAIPHVRIRGSPG